MEHQENPNQPKPAVKITGNKAIKIVGVVILLGLSALLVYVLLNISHQDDGATDLRSQIKQLQEENRTLAAELKQLKNEEENNTPKSPDVENEPTVDNNFVALRPDGGFLTGQTSATFTWTKHRDATKYVVEIKRPGQATYPQDVPSDQILSNPDTSKNELSLTKSFESGDYVWRISAYRTTNGQDKLLQSTEDRNYQVR